MIARNVESRITKLEARSARPDEMLVVWRLPGGDVAEALKNATFAKGDTVICAEWFDSSSPPAPRWYGDELRRAMTSSAYDKSIVRSIASRGPNEIVASRRSPASPRIGSRR